MAHPDDPELWAGGTLALHARDAPVTLAVSEHEAARMAEAAAGAAILGARLVVLPAAVSAGAVADLITDVRPDVLITHLLADVHPGHRETAEAVLAALPEVVIATGRPLRVYAADTYNSLTLGGAVSAPVIIDTTATYEQMCAPRAPHAGTQPIEDHFGPMADTLSRLWGARIGVPRAEAFTPVPVLGRVPATARL
jgi:LmbE family N-acetylglucosaminyl deacetylase